MKAGLSIFLVETESQSTYHFSRIIGIVKRIRPESVASRARLRLAAKLASAFPPLCN